MTVQQALPGLESPTETVTFEPTRAAGLARLDEFAPRTGRHYASQRNYDYGPDRRSNVSALSPWIRHRLISEEEVLRATLARFAPSTAEKFIQEVFWRGYFKGWLEQRPSVWLAYKSGLSQSLSELEKDGALSTRYEAAVAGQTGIDCFDAWAKELVETGYLHNHTRMWFASIWIFTLKLPWELGADFFLRHLLDGDPASNTLSWRWVAGLHTRGKTYLARVWNIAKFTQDRFRPEGQLSPTAVALTEAHFHPLEPIPEADAMPEGDFLLLLTEEDCHYGTSLSRPPAGVAGVVATAERSPLAIGEPARRFARGAVTEAVVQAGASPDALLSPADGAAALIAATEAAGVRQVVSAYAPVGPVAEWLAGARSELDAHGISLHQIRRRYDSLAWPHATKGFFALKKQIPRLLRELDLVS